MNFHHAQTHTHTIKHNIAVFAFGFNETSGQQIFNGLRGNGKRRRMETEKGFCFINFQSDARARACVCESSCRFMPYPIRRLRPVLRALLKLFDFWTMNNIRHRDDMVTKRHETSVHNG